MTEGVIPVMLTDVSLTPKTQLGRKLYDFSATMYEIAEGDSLNTLNSLGIVDIPYVEGYSGDIGTGQPSDLYRTVCTVGQLYEFYPSSNNNIITSGEIYSRLIDKYSAGGIYSTREAFNPYIKNVQIYFHSEPHIFYISSNNNVELVKKPTAAQLNSGKLHTGYCFQIQTSDDPQWKTIFVNEKGYYQINNHINVTGLAFSQYTDAVSTGDRVTVNYIIVYNERTTGSQTYESQSIIQTLVGQYQGVFQPEQYLGEFIRNKYSYATSVYAQFMQYWQGLSLDVTPFALAKIQYHGQDTMQEYMVGPTGVLHLLKDFEIDDMYFEGVQLSEQPLERRKYLAENEFVMTGIELEDTSSIKYPQMNNVYSVDGEDLIYYHNQWIPFTYKDNGTGIAAINVSGAINFLGTVVQVVF